MTKRRTTNKKLTTAREHRKKYIIRGVVKRGSNPRIQAAGRSVRRVLKAVFFAALLAGLCYGANEGYRKLFWENPDYSLKEVRYSTDGSLTRDMAIAVTGFKEGRNIFGYRLDSGRAEGDAAGRECRNPPILAEPHRNRSHGAQAGGVGDGARFG